MPVSAFGVDPNEETLKSVRDNFQAFGRQIIPRAVLLQTMRALLAVFITPILGHFVPMSEDAMTLL